MKGSAPTILLVCLAVLLAGGAVPLPAQNFRFEPFTLKNGLSNNTVYCITQDRRGFIWAGTRDGLNRFDGNRFVVYKNDQSNPFSLFNNQINALLEDREGMIWVGTHDGINVFDPRTERFRRFHHDPADAQSIRSNLIYCFWEDLNGDIWIGTDTKLEKFERKTGRFVHFEPPPVRADAPDEVRIHRMTGYKNDLFLAMWGAGIWHFDKKTGALHRIFTDTPGLNGPAWVSNIWADPHGTVWAVVNGSVCEFDPAQNMFRVRLNRSGGSELAWVNVLLKAADGRMFVGTVGEGLKIWDGKSPALQTYLFDPAWAGPLSNRIFTVFQDRSGQIWLGTFADGLVKFDPHPKPFETFPVVEKGRRQGQIKNISGLLETDDGKIWAASPQHGLRILDAGKHGFTALPNRPKWPAEFQKPGEKVMFQDRKGRFWLGTWGQGYLVWDEKTGDMRRFFYPGADQTLVQQNLVAYIFEASDGTIWVSTYRGVFRISVEESQPVFAKKFKFENLDDLGLGEDYVGMMGEDHLGNIWLTTLRRGLYCFHPTTRQIRRFQHDPDDPKTLGSRHISAIFEDREQRLWIGTTAGLQLFQPVSGQFVQFREKDGLPSDAVRGITEDARGFLWLTTRRGLSKFDPEHRTFLNYFKEDGLPCEEFATRSLGTCRRSGEIFAGGSEGFVLFHPDSIRSSNFVPPVAIAGLKKHVVAGGQIMAVSVPGISALDHIALPFSENTLTFEFAALDFQQVFKNQYAYRLLGISDHWAPLGAKQDVTFSNLPPGHYVLEVKASNAEGQWNEQGVRLNIDILPPWWSTWWACTAYGLVSGGILLAFFQLRHRRNRDKAKADRLHDLNEAKNQFLSTVSHELRTPLSSVMGFSKIIKKRLEERILPQTDMSDPKTERAAVQVMSNLDIVIGESERLTTLINEVLDLAKIESGLVIWHEERLNLAQLLERAVATTATLFEQKNLTLLKNIAPELPDPLGDPDRLLQVLVNLLSNAVKFTEQGTVTVSAWPQPDHTLVVGVADTGIGIPEGFRHLVFEKFRQVADDVLTDKPQGTGLGLSICREIVEHHGGRIWLESEVGRGSTFWFTLPLR